MRCANCGDGIISKPIKQNEEFFCSLECANLVTGIASEEVEEYYDEDVPQNSFEEYE